MYVRTCTVVRPEYILRYIASMIVKEKNSSVGLIMPCITSTVLSSMIDDPQGKTGLEHSLEMVLIDCSACIPRQTYHMIMICRWEEEKEHLRIT